MQSVQRRAHLERLWTEQLCRRGVGHEHQSTRRWTNSLRWPLLRIIRAVKHGFERFRLCTTMLRWNPTFVGPEHVYPVPIDARVGGDMGVYGLRGISSGQCDQENLGVGLRCADRRGIAELISRFLVCFLSCRPSLLRRGSHLPPGSSRHLPALVDRLLRQRPAGSNTQFRQHPLRGTDDARKLARQFLSLF